MSAITPPPQFDGVTFDSLQDAERLSTQLERVRAFVSDGHWHTLEELVARCGGTTASVSARLRDLRKARFGGLAVERRRLVSCGGSWEYRVIAAECLAPHRHTTAELVAELRAELAAANAALESANEALARLGQPAKRPYRAPCLKTVPICAAFFKVES